MHLGASAWFIEDWRKLEAPSPEAELPLPGPDDRMDDAEDRGSLPPYTYVPGGPWPHPISNPFGHSHDKGRSLPPPIGPEGWRRSGAFVHAVELFDAGFYWEAHEEWEGLWHAHGRRGPLADTLKALIHLAAAGVKVRQRQPGGIERHARRAADLLAYLVSDQHDPLPGWDLTALADLARAIAECPPSTELQPGEPASPVLGLFLVEYGPGRTT